MKENDILEVLVPLEIEEPEALDLGIEEDELLEMELEPTSISANNDYRKLNHKPSINGVELYDNLDEIDPTVPDWAKELDPGFVEGRDAISFAEIDDMFRDIFGK